MARAGEPGDDPGTARRVRPPEEPKLSLQRVLSTALGIVDAHGLEALSMRHLGQALQREPMALYRYAANKAALLDGVVETVLAELIIDPLASDWREELRTLGANFRRLAQAHPNVVPLLVTRPLATPLGLRPTGTLQSLENFLALLTRVGFTPINALHAYRLFFGFLHGHVLAELQEAAANPDETELLVQLQFKRLPASQFPQLRAVATDLTRYDGKSQLEEGIELMITGLEQHFVRRDK
jgi:AcrR family transcriptional regulator